MKCVKNVDGIIRRVKDEQATAYVKSGDWKYVPKSEWKAFRIAATEKKAAAKQGKKGRHQKKGKSQTQEAK